MVIIIVLVISLVYYFSLHYFYRFQPGAMMNNLAIKASLNRADFTETTIDLLGQQKILSYKYPLDMQFPDFVRRYKYESPEDVKEVDLIEGYRVNVISTGKLSTSEIKDSSGKKVLGEALLLEVYMDDTKGYLKSNNPFNIALRIYPPEGDPMEITPDWPSEILEEFNTDDNSKNLNVKRKTAAQEDIQKIFSENKYWVITPYVKDALTEYDKNSGDSLDFKINYFVLLDMYYGGKDSEFIDKIVADDMSDLRVPVLITHIRMD